MVVTAITTRGFNPSAIPAGMAGQNENHESPKMLTIFGIASITR
jgi:hypothetical protein